MFVCLQRTQTWRLHTKFYKFGWHTSANNSRTKNSRDLIFCEVVYISVIYRIQDSWLYLLMVTILVLITWLMKTENSTVVIRFHQLFSGFLTFLCVTVWHFHHRFFVFVCCVSVLELFFSLLIQDLKHVSLNMKFHLDVNQSREANNRQKYWWKHHRARDWTSLWYLHNTMYASQRLNKLASWNKEIFWYKECNLFCDRSQTETQWVEGVRWVLTFLRSFFRSQLVMDKFQIFSSGTLLTV